MEPEIWRVHPEYTGIEVSTFGRVRTLDRVISNETMTRFTKGKVLKPASDKGGYLLVNVSVDGKWATKKVHRLVAQTFIPNLNNSPEINHLDCDPTNNNVSNLEWCTHQENIAYRDKLGHTARNNTPKSPVLSVNLKTQEVSRFRSQREASRVLGFSVSNINGVISGKAKQSHGYWFINADDNAVDIINQKLHDIGKMGLILS